MLYRQRVTSEQLLNLTYEQASNAESLRYILLDHDSAGGMAVVMLRTPHPEGTYLKVIQSHTPLLLPAFEHYMFQTVLNGDLMNSALSGKIKERLSLPFPEVAAEYRDTSPVYLCHGNLLMVGARLVMDDPLPVFVIKLSGANSEPVRFNKLCYAASVMGADQILKQLPFGDYEDIM